MRRVTIFILILLVLLISFASCSKKSNVSNVGNLPNNFIKKENRVSAPTFALSTIDGGFISLDEFKGKVVLLDFWAEWCGPCKRATPIIVSLYEKYKSKGLVVIGMNLDDESDFDKVRSYIKETKISYFITVKGFSVAQKYGVSGIPKFVLIDKDGKIALTITGVIPTLKEDLENSIIQLLEE